MRNSSPSPARFPLAAKVVIAGSALMSCIFYGNWLWAAKYLPYWWANLGLAIAAGLLTAALDTLKPLFMSVAKIRWQAKHRLSSLGPALMALLLALVSVWAIDGLLLKLRADSSNIPANIITQWERTNAALRKAESDLKALGPSRPVAEITSAMGRVQIDVVTLRRTNHCTPAEITKEESRKACQPLIELHEEQARANRKVQVEATITQSRAWLDANPKPASPDPQLSTWAAITGLTEASVALVVAMTVGLALELVSLFGPVLLELPPPPKEEASKALPLVDITPTKSEPISTASAPPLRLADHRPKLLRRPRDN